ncbi:MAG: hypothetical protein ACLQLC_19140 [Candidatus Sulfotelmatobacter sp.]
MWMPIGFSGPLKKDNEALRKEIESLGCAVIISPDNDRRRLFGRWLANIGFIGPLKKENEALRKQLQGLRQIQLLAKQVQARSFRASGNSDAAMLSSR